jgi:hypothetical protein
LGRGSFKTQHQPFLSVGFQAEWLRLQLKLLLWPYISQITRISSGQMGMNPIDTQLPLSFDVPFTPELNKASIVRLIMYKQIE